MVANNEQPNVTDLDELIERAGELRDMLDSLPPPMVAAHALIRQALMDSDVSPEEKEKMVKDFDAAFSWGFYDE